MPCFQACGSAPPIIKTKHMGQRYDIPLRAASTWHKRPTTIQLVGTHLHRNGWKRSHYLPTEGRLWPAQGVQWGDQQQKDLGAWELQAASGIPQGDCSRVHWLIQTLLPKAPVRLVKNSRAAGCGKPSQSDMQELVGLKDSFKCLNYQQGKVLSN